MSHKITITLETGNAAFEDDETGEVARILTKLAGAFRNFTDPEDVAVKLHDINGNPVGEVKVKRT